jgi:hypothetical protein
MFVRSFVRLFVQSHEGPWLLIHATAKQFCPPCKGTLQVDEEPCSDKEILDVVRKRRAMPPARREDVKKARRGAYSLQALRLSRQDQSLVPSRHARAP